MRRLKKAVPWALGVFLVAFGVFALNNYECTVDSDPSTYLKFADSLARGRFFIDSPPDRVFQDYYPPGALYRATQTTLVTRGRAISFVGVGYPLFLALLITLGGKFAPFLANSLVFLALFWLLYLFVTRLFRSHPDARLIGLVAVSLYFIVNRAQIVSLLACYRDPFSYLLLLGSFIFFLAYLQDGHQRRHLALAGLLFGLAATVRETSILAGIPIGVMFLREYLPTRRPPLLKAVAAFSLWAVVGAVPLFVQNTVNTGNPLYPTQILVSKLKREALEASEVQRENNVAGLSFGNFSRTAPKLLGQVREKYGTALIALAILGLWLGRGVPGVLYFALPFVASYLVLYGLYVSTQWRYIFVVHMMVVPVVAFGFVEISRRTGGLLRLRALTVFGAAALFLYALSLALHPGASGTVQIPQARRFQRDFEAAVPQGAVVFAERPMRSAIDYFTHAHGVRPDDFVRPEIGLTVNAALGYFRGLPGGVYFFDSATRAPRNWSDRMAINRQKLLEFSDLKAVATFSAADYDMRSLFGRDSATAYEVAAWAGRVTEQEIAALPGRESLLRINARQVRAGVAAGGRLELFLDDHLVSSSVANGVNFFRIPSGWIGGPTVVVRMVSDAPLPRDVEPALIGLDEFLPVNIGPDAVPLDTSFLSEEFFRIPGEGEARFLAGEGRVFLPAAAVPGTTLMVLMGYQFDHAASSPQTRLEFAFAGKEQASLLVPAGGGWRTTSFPLSPGAVSNGVVSGLTVRTGLDDGGATAGNPPREYLTIDRFGVFRYDHARPVPAIDFGADDEMYLRSGFYRKEILPGGDTVRFSDGTAHVNLPCAAAAAGRAATIRLQVWGRPSSLPAPRCRIVLNGRPIGEFEVAPEVVQTFAFAVSAGVLREGINDLQILSPSWQPSKEFGSGDARVLGIMLDRLEILPAEDG